MVSISSAVSELESRRKALETELASVTSRLKAIQQALNVTGNSTSAPSLQAAETAVNSKCFNISKGAKGAGMKCSSTAGRRKLCKFHKWFASGEAVGLMKKLVREPSPAAEIVKVLARAKGYDKSLAPDQLKRFHGTAYMAVSNAVKAGAATKLKDGRVRIR
jgi:hypothetical protein